MELAALQNVSFIYGGAEKSALENVSLSIQEGELFLLCGGNGSGKTTLLRLLKPLIAPHGRLTGEILFRGQPVHALSQADQVSQIGYVGQDPEAQIVTDTVRHELAFGLESLGVLPGEIRRRVAEMASFFGLGPLMDRQNASLSGGQKQLVNLAAVMAQRPALLLLDEPTAQLDPIAAASFLQLVSRISRELSIGVLLSEQRLEEAFPLADRMGVLSGGKLLCEGAPAQAARCLYDGKDPMERALPAAARIGLALGAQPPFTVASARKALEEKKGHGVEETPAAGAALGREVLAFRQVWHRYEKNGADTAAGLTFSVREGEIYALLGANGAGKTTALGLASGRLRPYAGKVLLDGRPLERFSDRELFHGQMAVLPQDPKLLFAGDTLEQDLCTGSSKEMVLRWMDRFSLTQLTDRSPLDLSGGELQRAALVKLLLASPRLLLLDEPTKGLDAPAKECFAADLCALRDTGTAILMVSHDLDFCASFADKCGLLFGGQLVSEDPPRAFFARNTFYTTSARRIAQGLVEDAVTVEEVLKRCKV